MILILFAMVALSNNDKNIEILSIDENNDSVELNWILNPPQMVYSPSIFLKNKEINSKNIASQKTSIFFLVDTSLSMRGALSKGINPLLKNIINNLNSKRHNYAIAGFDKNLNIIKNFKDNFYLYSDTIDNLKVQGSRTELYRLSLDAISELKKQDTTRKILIMISDGDFEDTTYNVDNLIDEAKKNKIKILSFAYLESVKIQGIQKPALKTNGKMWIANKKTHKMKKGFIAELLPYFDNGGIVTFNKKTFSSTFLGTEELLLSIKTLSDDILEKKFTIQVAKKQKEIEKKGFKWNDYFAFILLLVAFLLGAIFIVLLKKDKKIDKRKVKKIIAILIDERGNKYEIWKNITSIGKAKDNDIVILASYISNYHAKIVYKYNKFSIFDRNSTNGIGVNLPAIREGNSKITQSKLKDGDKIYLGPIELKFQKNLI